MENEIEKITNIISDYKERFKNLTEYRKFIESLGLRIKPEEQEALIDNFFITD